MANITLFFEKRFDMIYILEHLYIHECMYDHPLVHDIYVYLRHIVCLKHDGLDLLRKCWSILNSCEDESIVWLASSYANKSKDLVLMNLVDNVKMDTL